MAKRKKQNLINAATVLLISTVLVKVIGAIYKIPLVSLIGVAGKGYFQAAYDIYTPVYTISMAGLPVAISRLVAENIAAERFRQAEKVLSVSKKIFLIIGIVGTLILAIAAYPYSLLKGGTQNVPSVLAIAPSIFFCCIMSAYRGYYQGMTNMYPTGISQVIESAGKLVFGLLFAFLTARYGLHVFNAGGGEIVNVFGVSVSTEKEALSAIYPYAAAAATLGVTMGSFFGMLFLILKNKLSGSAFTREEIINSPLASNSKDTAKEIIRIAIPIALSSMVMSISNFIDSVTMQGRLRHAIEIGKDTIMAMYGDSLNAASGVKLDSINDIATYLYGAYGLPIDIKNLVTTITMTLGVSVIPILAAAWSQKDRKSVNTNVESVTRLTMLIAAPAGFGLAALASPVIDLLYGRNNPDVVPIAAPIMLAYALPIAFYALATPLTNMLQAIGRTDVPLKSMAIGSVAKIVLNYILVGNPSINIKGAPYSSLVCYLIVVVYNFAVLVKETKFVPNIGSTFIKPLFSGAMCGGAAYLVYSLVNGKLGVGNLISTVVSIGTGAVVYLVMLILVKGFVREDIEMLPKGEKIVKVLEKIGIIG